MFHGQAVTRQTKAAVGEILYILCSTIALEADNFVAMALVLVVRERPSLRRLLTYRRTFGPL